ncbi:proteasome assembly chaperone 3-like [Leptinotarsa decemlineata]|uniref:proteasome assembly chaperone 3-like n=1 Tax=Leptinotarsa decemlineata TaxID=7539 RepID=UPI003D304F05
MDLVSSFKYLSVNKESSQVKSFAAVICGNHTEFFLTHFPNCINLVITQLGKIGNLYEVKVDQPENGLSISEPTYSITTLLGAENIDAEVAVRYLTEKLGIRKHLILCLSLKDYTRNSVDKIVEAIQNYPTH